MQLKSHLSEYERVFRGIYPSLGWEADQKRKACLIAVDGAMGAGKTHLANWLAWQFGAVAIHADLYWKVSPLDRTRVREKDFAETIFRRIGEGRIAIVEGTYSFKILNDINLSPTFKIVVSDTDDSKTNARSDDFEAYRANNSTLFSSVDFVLPMFKHGDQ